MHGFSKKEFAYSEINCNNKTAKNSFRTWVFPMLRTVKPFFFEGWPFEISGILKVALFFGILLLQLIGLC